MDIFTNIDKNKRESFLLIAIFIGFITLLGAIFGTALGLPKEEWISSIIFALFFSSISAFFSYFFSDKIILAISGAKEINQENAKELFRILENLCMASGLPMPKFYLINDPSPNAFATGRNPKNAAICVTTGLLEKLERSEIEGVIAHELAHVGNRDTLYMTLVAVLVGTVSLISDLFLRSTRFVRGNNNREKEKEGSSQIRLIFFILGIAFSIISPIIARLIGLCISRKREFLADATGAYISRNPEALAFALEKIAMDKTPLRNANSAMEHLYISNPFKGKKILNLFSTHPPTEERIKRLRGMVGTV